MEKKSGKKEKSKIEVDSKEGDLDKRASSEIVKLNEKKSVGDEESGVKESGMAMVLRYLVPILSILVFALILAFGAVPSAQSLLSKITELNDKKEEVADLDDEISALKNLQREHDQITLDLKTIDNIVSSEQTQVADFVGEIEVLAEANELEGGSYESGEEIQTIEEAIEEQQSDESVSIIHIPTTSEYTAELDDIKEFLNDLYSKDDFIIVSFMKMQGGAAREFLASLQESEGEAVTVNTALPSEVWTLKVTFEKYQFSESFSDYVDASTVSLSSEPDADTLEFIREKYSK